MINKLTISEEILSYDWAGKKLEIKSGKLAPSCNGSVVITLGETQMLVTAIMENNPKIDKDFMPLSVEVREMFYASGKIGGAQYTRREGRPSESAILTARLTDRPLRPLFPEGMINDVMITITILTCDRQNNAGVPAIIGSSLAVLLAGIPWDGPVGAVKIGYQDNKFIINPSYEEINKGILELTVAGTEHSITMVECGAKEIDTKILLEALEIAQQEINKICKLQKEFLEKFKITPLEITINKPDDNIYQFIAHNISTDQIKNLFPSNKKQFQKFYSKSEKLLLELAQKIINNGIEEEFINNYSDTKLKIGLFKYLKKQIRNHMFTQNIRIDNRQFTSIRPLYGEVGLIPNLHGTGLFQRGETQGLNICTLGAPGDTLIVDTMEEDNTEKRFFHHYNMPPFSTNEAKIPKFTSRREIGHGKLAEKAIEPILPRIEDFPYTIRLVTEILSSNGSTSMAAVCSSTLSLMDAGVPIINPISGIAMGLVYQDAHNYQILSDIQGLEDHIGDMDFKIAGSIKGITALQMDIKIPGISLAIMSQAIAQGNIGRLEILDYMLSIIDKPRSDINPNAPRIIRMQINPAQIKDVIGPGGAMINEIIKQTNVKIDFSDDGTCLITAKTNIDAQAAIQMIKKIVWIPTKGEKLEGTISRIENYGVFVNLGNNKSGLCHVKNLTSSFLADPRTAFKIGEKITVEIMGIDLDGKIQLKKI